MADVDEVIRDSEERIREEIERRFTGLVTVMVENGRLQQALVHHQESLNLIRTETSELRGEQDRLRERLRGVEQTGARLDEQLATMKKLLWTLVGALLIGAVGALRLYQQLPT